MSKTVIFDSSKSPPPPPSPQPNMPMSGNPHEHPPAPPTPSPPPKSSSPKPNSLGHEKNLETYRLMDKREWLQFCRGIGILKDEEGDEVIRSAGKMWPPSAFKDGLYRDVLYEKTKFTYYYHALSIIYWVLMLLQMALSAILTALGAASKNNGTPITIIAAVNTSVAGILALLHNSGLPDRYRWNRDEFYKLEEHMKAIVDTGLVPSDRSVNDVLAECFDMLATALQTVQKNAPTMYTPASGTRPLVAAPPLAPPPQQQQQHHHMSALVRAARRFDSEK